MYEKAKTSRNQGTMINQHRKEGRNKKKMVEQNTIQEE